MVRQLGDRIRFFFVVGSSAGKLVLLFSLVLLAQQETADLSRKGADAMRAGRFSEAETIFRELVLRYPRQPQWHGNLGLALHSQGRYRDATVSLERSVKIQPNAGLATILGIDYLELRQPCQAIAPLQKTDRFEALAEAYNGCKRYRSAAHLYEKLKQPRLAARAYWHARDYENARRIFQAIAAQHAGESDFAYEYGDTLLRSQGAEAAIPILLRSTALMEGRGTLGRALVEAGRFEEAIPHLEAAVKADPDLLLPLSRAYKEAGRAAEAEQTQKEYRKRAEQQN